MPEAPLQELPGGKIKISAEHFRKVVRRIEDIKPLAGPGIKITPKEGGIEISASVTQGGGLAGLNPSGPYGEIELTVCYNGVPSVVYVLGYNPAALSDDAS